MTGVERISAALAGEDPAWIGVAAGGWLIALLAAWVAVWQAARADAVGARVAEAAHELRGPLCAARLALAGLHRALADALPVSRGVAAVELELERAGLALEDLVDVGSRPVGRRAGRTRSRRELVDLAALARTAEPAWQALAAAHATSLEVRLGAGPLLVLGDPRRLLQGIENLIVNACEHGRGPVRVAISEGGRGVRVEVADAGGGPRRDVLRRARRRARTPWLPRRYAARGHGMTVAARVALYGGGRLRLRPGAAGSAVCLELPSHPAARRRLAWAAVRPARRRVASPGAAYDPGRPEPLAGAR